MIGSTRQVTVWAYGAPADLRKGFDEGLTIQSQMLWDQIVDALAEMLQPTADPAALRAPRASDRRR